MGHLHKLHFLLLCFVVAGFYFTGSDGLKDVRLEGPGYVRRGETVTLSCHYDMEKDTLYAVKWYQGNREFYRYVPKEVPPTQVFSLPGIFVDISGSNDHNVVLQSVPLEISGKYKCQVSVEGTFETLHSITELIVVAVGYESPFLSVQNNVFHGGDTVKANCSIKQTSRPANITWWIDDKEVRPEENKFWTQSFRDMNDSSVFNTMSMLTYELPPTFSTKRLKCTGQLFDIYAESSVFEIRLTPPQRSHALSSSNKLIPSSSSTNNRGFAQDFHQAGLIMLMLAQMYLAHLIST